MFFYLTSCCLSYLSVHLFYMLLLNDFSGMKNIITSFANGFDVQLSILITICYMLPQLFLGISQYEYLWCIFPFSIALLLFLFVSFLKALKEKEFAKLFLIFYIFATILFNMLLAQAFRYLIPIFPFVILFLAISYHNSKVFKKALPLYLLYVLCLSVVKVSYFDLYYLQNKNSSRNLLTHLPKEAVLLSSSPRYSYFYLRKRTCVNCGNFSTYREVLIYGDQLFINEEITRIEKLTPVKGKSIYEASWRLDRTSEESKLAHLKL